MDRASGLQSDTDLIAAYVKYAEALGQGVPDDTPEMEAQRTPTRRRPTTRYLFALAACLACSHPPASVSTVRPAAYPFHAIGRTDAGRVIEDLAGTAYVHDDEIRVVVTSGFARLQPSRFRRPVGLSAGLAYCHTEGKWAGYWGFRRESGTVAIRDIKVRGDTLADASFSS